MLTGKEALIAVANGEEVECRAYEKNWINANNNHHPLSLFFDDSFQFRLKPRTITINGIEVPAPFEPNKDDDCRVYVIDTRNINGYDWQHSSHFNPNHIVWRTESEIKQVVAALRSIFK